MTEAGASKQIFRKTALVIAYACVAAFGAVVMLTFEHRPLDGRGQMIVAIVGAGALLAGSFVMLYARRLLALPPLLRLAAVFVCTSLATLLMQGLLAAIFFNMTSLRGYGPLATLDGLEDLFLTSIYGFLYYLAYGPALVWPICAAAAFLYALGFLTLRSQKDTTYTANRSRQ